MICRNCNREIGGAAVCPYCRAQQSGPAAPHHLCPDTIIGGRYLIQSVLGEGGFGITYVGRDLRLDHIIAVKEYFPHGFSYRNNAVGNEIYVSTEENSEFFIHGREQFLKEARTLARFTAEPGVVSVTDYLEENNTAYLIMEFLEGVTLEEYLRMYGVLSADEAFSMMEPVMRTLEKIHAAGVIHRDISPDNIMRLNNGQLKLMDFGAAREYIDKNRSMSVLLKRGFAPLEQYSRNGVQGPWTDVYALCATIYHAITGRLPDDSLDRMPDDNLRRPSELGASISPAQENVLMYGLAVRRENRCQSMAELLALLEQAKRDPGARSYNSIEGPGVTVGFDSDESALDATKPADSAAGDRGGNTVTGDRTSSHGADSQPPKKKGNAKLIIAIAAALVLIVGVVILISSGKSKPSPIPSSSLSVSSKAVSSQSSSSNAVSGDAAVSGSDLASVTAAGKLRVGVTDYKPLDYFSDGEWIGFDADLARAFADGIGVEAEFVEVDWDNIVPLLNSGNVDCIWNGLSLTEQRKSVMSCSDAYLDNAQVVVVNKSVASKYQSAAACKNLQFVVETGSMAQFIAEDNGFSFSYAVDQAAALSMVASGEYDAAIVDAVSAAASVGEGTGYDQLTYTVSLNSEKYCVGFREGSDLTAKCNTFFSTVKSNGKLRTIAETYGVQAALIE